MKSRSSLAMMEQLVMLAVFALAVYYTVKEL